MRDAGAPSDDLPVGDDGLRRCWWAAESPALARYHDEEWGRGPRDEQGLFERLSLEAFQAGLSWRLVLERRAALRDAFQDFDPVLLARRSHEVDADVERLLTAPGMIRNRAKIAAVLTNATTLVTLHDHGSGLRAITDDVVRTHPAMGPPPRRRADVPARSPASVALAKRLRGAGWRFIGPTTAHAYLQAAGWVDDHLADCHARGTPVRTGPLG